MTNKVLLVDDDEGVLALLAAALEREGCLTTAVGSADAALERLKDERFPVVISDIMMPDMDGLTLLTRIKAVNPDVQVIMITAYATVDAAITALKNGATSFLKKPFDPDELVSQTRNALEKYRLLDENKRLMAELRAAKEYNEQVIRDLVYTVIVLDTQGRIKKINRAMEELLGYREAEIAGQPVEMLFTDGFRGGAWQDLLKEKKVFDYPVHFRAKDGREVTATFTGTVMKDADGKVIGFIGTSRSVDDTGGA